jgi:hypothetical protein
MGHPLIFWLWGKTDNSNSEDEMREFFPLDKLRVRMAGMGVLNAERDSLSHPFRQTWVIAVTLLRA